MSAIRIYPTGTGSEAWNVERNGVLLGHIRLTIHATLRGEYTVTYPDRPDIELWNAFAYDGRFAFKVWNQETVREVLTSIVAPDAGEVLTIEIKHPTR